jgi:hypothetical protein
VAIVRILRTPAPSANLLAGADIATLVEQAQLARVTNVNDTQFFTEFAQTNAGTIPGIARTPVSGNITLTAGQTIQNLTISGRVICNVANAKMINCEVLGGVSENGSALVDCQGTGASNLLIDHCNIHPQNPYWGWMGVTGSNFVMRHTQIHHCQDNIEVKRSGASYPWNNNINIEDSWFHSLAWWTASAAGIIHPSDTATHNDGIQIFGGQGFTMRRTIVEGRYARDYGHWKVTQGQVVTPPFTTVPLNSLGDSLNGPNQDIFGEGSSQQYAYNDGAVTCIQFGDELGTTSNVLLEDCVFVGGSYALNGGGNANRAGVTMLTMNNCVFTRDQGKQGSGGNTTYTTALGPWSGQVSLSNNTYEDGQPITVRY